MFAFYKKAGPKDQYSLALLPSKTFPTILCQLMSWSFNFFFLAWLFFKYRKIMWGNSQWSFWAMHLPLVYNLPLDLWPWAFGRAQEPALLLLKPCPTIVSLLRQTSKQNHMERMLYVLIALWGLHIVYRRRRGKTTLLHAGIHNCHH